MDKNPEYATSDNSVLMAMARTFPSGLDNEETLVYPNPGNIRDAIVNRSKRLFDVLEDISFFLEDDMSSILRCQDSFQDVVLFFLRVPPIRNLEKKKKEYDHAKRILDLVCMKIKEKHLNDRDDSFYEGPFLEAACRNASEVVNGILKIWPQAIRCTNKNGHDIIQLATIHRSEKVYNLIYSWGDRMSIYRTMKDSSNNNMLHLAGRLAPSNKLKLITGAALQLQRELQWREEVKKIVYPASMTEVNIFNDTPEMVFTKEHQNLVKEGEEWIKTVAESCSITATLIITIVFAAAITVPGGTRQETGIPMFLEEAAFTVFAISDAISLFSSTTALLLFLSTLTARFAQEGFLSRLPRRLIIGLCALLISTAAMMVAFGATLFLVFCRDKMWMLVPVCGLAFLPIAVFCYLQVPLMIDLFQSTYISMFGKDNHNNSNLDPNDMRFFFGK
ncbi:putative PGG domain-containing protein [Helianthus annuus]|nr:putative PGG domain-containing protein [Helianthus annuus]